MTFRRLFEVHCWHLFTVQIFLEEFPNFALEDLGLGQLPIHVACIRKCERSVIRLLVDSAPKTVTSQDFSGRTPLHFALNCDTSKLCDLPSLAPLIVTEALSIRDNQGETPLHVACFQEDHPGMLLQPLMYMLEKCPALIRMQDNDGCIPLFAACSGKRRSEDIGFGCNGLTVIYYLLQLDPQGAFQSAASLPTTTKATGKRKNI